MVKISHDGLTDDCPGENCWYALNQRTFGIEEMMCRFALIALAK
jgi:hypothetical protein